MLGFFLSRTLRIPTLRNAWVLVIAATFLLGALGSGIEMARSTGEQYALAYMGSHDAEVSAGEFMPGTTPADLTNVAVSAGASSASEQYVLTTVRLDQGLTMPIIESNWPRSGFSAPYQLTSGRWPDQPGEAVVSEAGSLVAASAWSARWSFTIVGTTRSTVTDSKALLVAPGTMAILRLPGPAEDYPGVIGRRDIAWTGGNTKDIVDALAQATGEDPDRLSLNVSTRADTSGGSPQNPLVNLPGIAGPFVVGAVAGMLVARWLRKLGRGLHYQGIGRRQAYGAVLVTTAISVSLATCGYPLGWLATSLAHPLLAPLFTHDVFFHAPSVPLTALTLLSSAAGAVLAAAAGMGVVSRGGVWPRRAGPVAMVVGGLVALGLAVSQSDPWFQRVGIVLLGSLAALNLARYAFVWWPRRSRSTLPAILGGRVLLRDVTAASSTAAALAAVTALTVGLLTIGVTGVNEQNKRALVQPTPQGHALVVGGSGQVPATVLSAFEEATGLSDPFTVGLLNVTLDGQVGGVATLPDIAAVERWLERPLTEDETALLQQGGVLAIDHETGKSIMRTPQGNNAVEVRGVTFREHNYSISAVLLAGRVSLTPSRTGYYFTSVPAQVEKNMSDRLASAGVDRTWVLYHGTPPVFTLSPRMSIALAGAGALSSLLLVAAALAQARTLRSYGAAFLAMGIPKRWVRRVFRASFWPVTAVSLVAGFGTGLVASVVAAIVGGAELTVPWAALGGWASGIALGSVVAAAFGLSRIDARERI